MNFEQITTMLSSSSIWKRCLCYRKGNEFWANHNFSFITSRLCFVVFVTAKVMNFEQITTYGATWNKTAQVVFVTAKVMNFEQITTHSARLCTLCGCLCYRKGNEFWANHNKLVNSFLCQCVVFVTAKVMNFEQITTNRLSSSHVESCLCYRKGNEFWANHNRWPFFCWGRCVVFVTAKVMNFEQITTLKLSKLLSLQLSLLPQR